MCQAYESERNFIVAGEKYNRQRGFEAQKRGEPKSANPNFSYAPKKGEYFAHDYDFNAWNMGWDTAAAGRELW